MFKADSYCLTMGTMPFVRGSIAIEPLTNGGMVPMVSYCH